MPLRIAPEDKKLFIGFGILCVITVLLAGYTVHTDGGSGALPSSYSAGNSGTKAAFMLLEQTGYAPQRWTENPAKLAELAKGGTLVMAEPMPTDERDMAAVRKFVSDGGRLVLTGMNGSLFFSQQRPRPGVPHFQWKSYKPAEPSELARGIDAITMAPQFYFDSTRGETPFRDGDERPIVRFAYGAGEVIWWSATDPMTNSAIRESDNAQLLLNSVGHPGRGPVYWDEYFHQNAKTVVDSIMASPLRWGLAQLALIGIVVCFTYSRRFGPFRQSIAATRAAPMEYVETLAALYHKAGAAHIPVEVVYERLRARLRNRCSLRTDASIEEVAQAIAHTVRNVEAESVARTLREIEDSVGDPSLPASRATELVREMHEWGAHLK